MESTGRKLVLKLGVVTVDGLSNIVQIMETVPDLVELQCSLQTTPATTAELVCGRMPAMRFNCSACLAVL